MKTLLIFLLLCGAASAASPARAWAIANITLATDWTDAGSPNKWASSCGGTPGTGGADGGLGVPVLGFTTATIHAGVPGAAGKGDQIGVCTGITVTVVNGIGIELNKGTIEATDSLTVQATDQTTYGSFLIGPGGLVRLHGSGTLANYANVNRYADFHVLPGGELQFGTTAGIPSFLVNGRAYFGCGDQAFTPMLDCAGNAGGWVTATVASTLNFTGTLPTGIAAGQLVELSPIQQPTAWAYPYTSINGVTPPPTPPIMPTTNDTGAVTHTCGSLATCLVPPDTLLCVVAVSGSTVSLGWPLGGNPWTPYCTGSEVAMAITSAGSGQLWLKYPARVRSDPAQTTWNNAVSSPAGDYGSPAQIDPIRATLIFGNQPVSNAAGTGPGRPGDNSLLMPSFTDPFVGVPVCTATSVQAVTAGTCYIDYNTARMTYGIWAPAGFTASTPVTFTGATPTDLSNGFIVEGQVTVPAGARTYNELVVENVDIRGVQSNSANSFFALGVLPNTANNRMGWRFNSTALSNSIVGLYTFTASSSAPVPVNYNSFTDSQFGSDSYDIHIGVWGSPNYFDVSNNRVHSSKPLFACGAQASDPVQDINHGTLTNNVIEGDGLIGGDASINCQWRNFLIQQNRVQGTGTQKTIPRGTYVGFATGIMHNFSYPSEPNRIDYNQFYGNFRGATLSGNMRADHNDVVGGWHHGFVIDNLDGGNSGFTAFFGGYISGLTVDHNLIRSVAGECQDLGYLNQLWIDGLVWTNNTCLGPPPPAVGLLFGDQDGGALQMFTGAQVTNNIFYPATHAPVGEDVSTGISKQNSEQTHMQQVQMSIMGYNSGVDNSQALLQGVIPTANPNAIPNKQYNRNVIATQSGTNYNTSLTRNITGVAIQNPSYSTTQAGNIALKYTYTSASNITMQLSSNTGSTYGTAVQLNWGGSGQTYTIASITDPGSTHQYYGVTVSGTPFAAMNYSTIGSAGLPTTIPATRFAVMLTGSHAGSVFGLMAYQNQSGGASGNITFVSSSYPRVLVTAADTFAVINTEIRLTDAGGTNYVDIGIDARSLPTSTQTDTGITLTNRDYCGACTVTVIATGLPNSYTQGGPATPLFPLPLPLAGGSAEAALCLGQSGCGGTPYFQPTLGSGWETAALSGGYIGAVAASYTPTPAAGRFMLSGQQ